MRLTRVMTLAVGCFTLLGAAAASVAAQNRPNILMIWGDDIGQWNVSAYNRGSMGYMTPNIDRIASEGILLLVMAIRPRWTKPGGAERVTVQPPRAGSPKRS